MRAAEVMLEVDNKDSVISELEKVTLEPGFWDDQNTAQQVMSDISRCQEELQMVSTWNSTLDDISVALELHSEDKVRPDSDCPEPEARMGFHMDLR